MPSIRSFLQKANELVLGPVNVFSTLFGVCYAIPNMVYNTLASNKDDSDYHVSLVVSLGFISGAISAFQKYGMKKESKAGRVIASLSTFVVNGLAGGAAMWPVSFAIANTLVKQYGSDSFNQKYEEKDQDIHVYAAFGISMLSLVHALAQEYLLKGNRSKANQIPKAVNEFILQVLGAISITWVALFAAENALIEQFDSNAKGYHAKAHNTAVLGVSTLFFANAFAQKYLVSKTTEENEEEQPLTEEGAKSKSCCNLM